MPTPYFGLPLYTATDTAALDTLLNGQSSAIDNALLANVWQFSGTDAARIALTAPRLREGIRWRSTDTGTEWYRSATTWLPLSWTSWTPTWSASNSAPSVGNGTLTGEYRYTGSKTVEISFDLIWGNTTSGGQGNFSFSLPPGVTASTLNNKEQIVFLKLFGSPGNFTGFGLISPGGTTVLPWAPLSGSTPAMGHVRNADAASTLGSGIPAQPGQFTFNAAGHNLHIDGVVRVQ
jgi:hypothetical protein